MAAVAFTAVASACEPEDQPGGDRGGDGQRRANAAMPALSRPGILDDTRVDVVLTCRGSWGSLKSHANVLR
jgi:hypothetical protein